MMMTSVVPTRSSSSSSCWRASSRRATLILLISASMNLFSPPHQLRGVDAFTYNVTPNGKKTTSSSSATSTSSSSAGVNSMQGDDSGRGASSSSDNDDDYSSGDVFGLSEALALAGAGDTIYLTDGTYEDSIKTVTDGEKGSPITIMGGAGAVIKATSPCVLVQHSWITLTGFSVDGQLEEADEEESYANKCVWVEGAGGNVTYDPLDGFVMDSMSVQNCGSECVRLKNFVTNATISGNTIQDCGIYDYRFDGGGKNGEGIYIGTSSSQWTYGADGCAGNIVSGNTIVTNGNECVDIKEGSCGNIVERNVCSEQLDENSGCFGSRSDSNTFRYNNISNCLGSGVRVGGWVVDDHEYGQDNNVYGNSFTNTSAGALSINTTPQGLICGNVCEDGSCDIIGDDDIDDIEANWDEQCDIEDLEEVTGSSTSTVTGSSTSATEPASSGSHSSDDNDEAASSVTAEEGTTDDDADDDGESSVENGSNEIDDDDHDDSEVEESVDDDRNDDGDDAGESSSSPADDDATASGDDADGGGRYLRRHPRGR